MYLPLESVDAENIWHLSLPPRELSLKGAGGCLSNSEILIFLWI